MASSWARCSDMPFLTRDACHWPTNFLSFFSYLERVLGRSAGSCSSSALDNGNVCCINKPAVSVLGMVWEVESGRKLDSKLLCALASGFCPEQSVLCGRGWLDLAPDASVSSATSKHASEETGEPLLRLPAVVPLLSRAWRADDPSLPGRGLEVLEESPT